MLTVVHDCTLINAEMRERFPITLAVYLTHSQKLLQTEATVRTIVSPCITKEIFIYGEVSCMTELIKTQTPPYSPTLQVSLQQFPLTPPHQDFIKADT